MTKPLPSDPEAERAVIEACFTSDELAQAAVEELHHEMFHHECPRTFFRTVEMAVAKHVPIVWQAIGSSPLSNLVPAHLQQAAIGYMPSGAQTIDTLKKNCEIVYQKHLARLLIQAAQEIERESQEA